MKIDKMQMKHIWSNPSDSNAVNLGLFWAFQLLNKFNWWIALYVNFAWDAGMLLLINSIKSDLMFSLYS